MINQDVIIKTGGESSHAAPSFSWDRKTISVKWLDDNTETKDLTIHKLINLFKNTEKGMFDPFRLSFQKSVLGRKQKVEDHKQEAEILDALKKKFKEEGLELTLNQEDNTFTFQRKTKQTKKDSFSSAISSSSSSSSSSITPTNNPVFNEDQIWIECKIRGKKERTYQGTIGEIVSIISKPQFEVGFQLMWYKSKGEQPAVLINIENASSGMEKDIYNAFMEKLAERELCLLPDGENWMIAPSLLKKGHQKRQEKDKTSTATKATKEESQPLIDDDEITHTSRWWTNWSNAFALVAALSGVMIPVLNQSHELNSYSDGEAQIMLIASAAVMGVFLLATNLINRWAHKKQFDGKVDVSLYFGINKQPYFLCLALGMFGAAGVAASCGWILSTGAWNEFDWTSRLLDSQPSRIFTALYATLCGATAGYAVAQGVEMNRLRKI